ncbi:MAG: sensor histidine kinase [Clostridiales bacterium]|jgi:two-component system NtrC family sensor kinase|nr:sensor histidine kinase [Clostridiales bacterium]
MRNNGFTPWWESIKYRLLIFGIIMSIIPLSLLGYLSVQTARKNLEQNIQMHNQVTSQRLAADLESIIGGQIRQIVAVARIDGKSLLNSERSKQEGILYGLLREVPYLEEVSLVGEDGRELARASRRRVVGNSLLNMKDEEAFLQLKEGNSDWSNTFLDSYGQIRLQRIIPITSLTDGDFRGGMILEISLRRVIEQLAQRQPEHKGRLFVVDSKGKLIGHQDFSQVLRQTDVRDSLAVKEFMQADISDKISAVRRYSSYDGKEVLGGFAPVAGLGWAVIQEVPVKQAFAPVKQLENHLLLLGTIIILLAIAVSIFFGIRFSNSLRNLEQGVQEIRKGNLDYEVRVQGRDELSRLGETLNMMRKELRTSRQKEHALRQAEKLSSLGLLASGVAHELNNPLGVISAYAEDLQEQLAEGNAQDLVIEGELQYYLQIIIKQSRRCKEIIGNLLNFARKSRSENEKVDLRQVVDNTLQLVKYRIEKKEIATEVNIPNSIPTLTANFGDLQQVLLNVITNALDALETGGWLKISASIEEKHLFLKIMDNGSGIEQDDLNRIFEPFFTTKEPGRGTGLGLSICYGIMQKMGGRIAVESVPGEGTTVTLVFPLSVREGK